MTDRPITTAAVVGCLIGLLAGVAVIRYTDLGRGRPRPFTPPWLLPPTITADLDGDGNPDLLRIDLQGEGEVQVTLASGITLRAPWPWPGERSDIAGTADIAGDGRQQVLVHHAANDGEGGIVIAVEKTRLVVNDFHDQQAVPDWGIHSNCCPEGTADVACLTVAGRPSLVVTSSDVRPRGWTSPEVPTPAIYNSPRDQLERRWSRSVYRLDGARFVLGFEDNGVLGVDETSPPDVPLNNRLSCGTAHGP